MWSRLSSGRLKVCASLRRWLDEVRLYRRDQAGRIVKERDHLMDCTRYLLMSGMDRARVPRPVTRETSYTVYDGGGQTQSWMQ